MSAAGEDGVGAEALRAAARGALAARLPARFLAEQRLVPLAIAPDGALVVAAGAPPDATVLDDLARVFGAPVRVQAAEPAAVQAALLGAGRDAPADGAPGEAPALGASDLRAQANDAPVIQVVNALLGDALRAGASDVHLESTRDGVRVRQRLDGVLRDVATFPVAVQAGVLARLKLVAGLDVAERRAPQDGRARVRLDGREVDLRVSTLPALHGEGIVVRVLDQGDAGAPGRSLAALGMPALVRARFERAVGRASGLVLVTGPTGSGKTTTLYAALALRHDPGAKLVTVEDPVEYQVAGVTQVPVQRKAGVGFAAALRAILRHDPDVVMVGEMRDRETAEVAVQAALTGHLVLSTLHTTDAAGAVTRLVDMGIEPYLVAATVEGVVAQRLVRVTCPACAAPLAADDAGLARLREAARDAGDWAQARRGRGCDACAGTGYRGRTGLFEFLRPATGGRAPERTPTLLEAGAALVRAGTTTPEEIGRVISLDEGA